MWLQKKNLTAQNMKPIYVLKILKYTIVYFGFFEELEIFPAPISRPTLLESEECLHFVKNPTIQQKKDPPSFKQQNSAIFPKTE